MQGRIIERGSNGSRIKSHHGSKFSRSVVKKSGSGGIKIVGGIDGNSVGVIEGPVDNEGEAVGETLVVGAREGASESTLYLNTSVKVGDMAATTVPSLLIAVSKH